MKITKLTAILASALAAGSLLLIPAVSSASVPGKGWDSFNSGQGEAIVATSYMGTAAGAEPGLGFDAFRSGDGVKIEVYEQAYMGTSLGSNASDAWDVFRIGQGDPLP